MTKINIIKTTDKNQSEKSGTKVMDPNTQKLQDMQFQMQQLFLRLKIPTERFSPEDVFQELAFYIFTYKRILYTTVSHIIYDISDKNLAKEESEASKQFRAILTNIEKLVAYSGEVTVNSLQIKNIPKQLSKTEKEKMLENTKEATLKLWDHVNLAYRQYSELRQSDDEYDEKFSDRIGKFQNKLMREMNAQLLTIVAIFTALAFIMFGGISSLANVLADLKSEHLLRLIIITCVWGIGMLNITFVFLFCVSKLTKINSGSFHNSYESFFQQYSVVCWTNYILISLFVVLSWIYFCLNRNITLVSALESYFAWISFGIIALVGIIGYKVYKSTRTPILKDDK